MPTRAGRVSLREPTARDRDEYLALKEKSRAFLAPWATTATTAPPGRSASPSGPREFDALLRANRGGRNVKRFVCRREDGAIVGAVNLNEIVLGGFRSAYLGYWIGAPHARRGYMTEALQLALALAFRTLHLHRVEANIVPGNLPSRRLVRRAGFRREGVSLRYLRIANRWRDHERWALLADEWEPLRARRP